MASISYTLVCFLFGFFIVHISIKNAHFELSGQGDRRGGDLHDLTQYDDNLCQTSHIHASFSNLDPLYRKSTKGNDNARWTRDTATTLIHFNNLREINKQREIINTECINSTKCTFLWSLYTMYLLARRSQWWGLRLFLDCR